MAAVPVALVKEKSVRPKVTPVRLVKVALVEKKLVVVALVPVALPKERELADTKEPENVEFEIEALVKVPPPVRLEITLERRPESLSDCF